MRRKYLDEMSDSASVWTTMGQLEVVFRRTTASFLVTEHRNAEFVNHKRILICKRIRGKDEGWIMKFERLDL
jgi:hypothetical protein